MQCKSLVPSCSALFHAATHIRFSFVAAHYRPVFAGVYVKSHFCQVFVSFLTETKFWQDLLWKTFRKAACGCRGLLWGSRAPKSSVFTTTACKLWRCHSLLPCKAISLQKTGRVPTRFMSSLLSFLIEAALFLHFSKPVWTVLQLCKLNIGQTKPRSSHQLWSSGLIADSFCNAHSNACFPVLSRKTSTRLDSAASLPRACILINV